MWLHRHSFTGSLYVIAAAGFAAAGYAALLPGLPAVGARVPAASPVVSVPGAVSSSPAVVGARGGSTPRLQLAGAVAPPSPAGVSPGPTVLLTPSASGSGTPSRSPSPTGSGTGNSTAVTVALRLTPTLRAHVGIAVGALDVGLRLELGR